MPLRGITPYSYNHENWKRNVKYWNKHPVPDRTGDITEQMIESLIESRKDEESKDHKLSKHTRSSTRTY
jgi:hypothetical protein